MTMTKAIEADVILTAAEPLVHQHAPEIQAYGHIIRMPIALSENARKESIENIDDDAGRLDVVAGSEFLDDRIRQRE
jgi:hypothetical protein